MDLQLDITSLRNSSRTSLLAWQWLLIAESIIFLSLAWLYLALEVDHTSPLPRPFSIDLFEVVPVALLALSILLLVTYLIHLLSLCPSVMVDCSSFRSSLLRRMYRDYSLLHILSPWHSLGFSVAFAFLLQIISGFFVATRYVPGFHVGYLSVESLRRDTILG